MTDEIRNEKIREWLARCLLRNEDPTYRENARRLSATYDRTEDVHAEVARERRFQASGAPERVRAAALAPRSEGALAEAQTHLASPSPCVFLILAGPCGRGKTSALAWAVTERGGRYVTAQPLVNVGTFDRIWRELAVVPVLALDELGGEIMNDAYRAALYELLDDRYRNLRPTLMATNLDGEAFRLRYCPNAGDRLFERLTKGGRWVNLPGESLHRHWREDMKPSP